MLKNNKKYENEIKEIKIKEINKKLFENKEKINFIRNDLNLIENILIEMKYNENEIIKIMKIENNYYIKTFNKLNNTYKIFNENELKSIDYYLKENEKNIKIFYNKMYKLINEKYINLLYENEKILL